MAAAAGVAAGWEAAVWAAAEVVTAVAGVGAAGSGVPFGDTVLPVHGFLASDRRVRRTVQGFGSATLLQDSRC